MKGSVNPSKVPGELGAVLNELTSYKTGKVYMGFTSVAELFLKLDNVVQDYVNIVVARYA